MSIQNPKDGHDRQRVRDYIIAQAKKRLGVSAKTRKKLQVILSDGRPALENETFDEQVFRRPTYKGPSRRAADARQAARSAMRAVSKTGS